MYNLVSSNEYFQLAPANICSGGHAVTATCPFMNHAIDSQLIKHTIAELVYVPKRLCVGAVFSTGPSNGYGKLSSCGDNNGNNSGFGTILVATANNTELVDRDFADIAGENVYMCSGGVLKGPLVMNFASAPSSVPGSCKWGTR
jgi:hypothetical protein